MDSDGKPLPPVKKVPVGVKHRKFWQVSRHKQHASRPQSVLRPQEFPATMLDLQKRYKIPAPRQPTSWRKIKLEMTNTYSYYTSTVSTGYFMLFQ